MMDAKYVLCRWEKRLWPAKVLARTKTSTKNKRKNEFFLDVQILSLEEKIQVKSTAVEVLHKSHIENIAALLASQTEAPAAPLEELTYRRSLRVALDVLDERTSLNEERPSRKEAVVPSQGEKQCMGTASSPPASLSPSFLPEAASGPGRKREHAQQRGLGSSTCEKDPKCKVDHKKGLRKSEDPRAPLLPSAGDDSQDGSGSRIRHGNWTLANRRGRNWAQKASRCLTEPVLSGGESDEESERQAGSGTALPSPPQAREDNPRARGRGHGSGVPAGRSTVLPAPEGARRWPAKRLRLDGGQRLPAAHLGMGAIGPALTPRQGPRGSMTLRSAAKQPSPPHSDTPAGEASSPLQDRDRLEQDPLSSEESVEFNTINSVLEEDEEDEEPPRILLYHEPRSFEVGMLVWHKFQKYPFWPAVVKSVKRREKKASVLFIEGDMNPKGKGITVSLRRLKHFDCKEKQMLLNKAKEDFGQAIGSCISLITDYRVRLGCGSFAGSFLEYYAANISYPVRKSIQQDALGTRFPQLSKGDTEEPMGGSSLEQRQPCRKVLPDRSRAARDRANQKLVEYIVKARGAESHLRAVLKSRRPSRWLKTFLSSGQYMTCVETYLEDEEQLDRVVKYLQGVYQEMDGETLMRVNGDRIRFILDVLLPEAIICAISAVDAVDYKTAEEKYIKGPSLSYREKEIFDNQLREERNRRRW